jgi:hypothetical protein
MSLDAVSISILPKATVLNSGDDLIATIGGFGCGY